MLNCKDRDSCPDKQACLDHKFSPEDARFIAETILRIHSGVSPTQLQLDAVSALAAPMIAGASGDDVFCCIAAKAAELSPLDNGMAIISTINYALHLPRPSLGSVTH